MVQVQLQPLAKSPEALATYIDANFRRLADALSLLGRVEQAQVEITGSVTIDTGIPVVRNVVACLAEPPIANAAYVTAEIDSTNTRQVIIRVYKSDFTASATATNVNMIAIGDEPPYRAT